MSSETLKIHQQAMIAQPETAKHQPQLHKQTAAQSHTDRNLRVVAHAPATSPDADGPHGEELR
jgi:hypothetical protein